MRLDQSYWLNFRDEIMERMEKLIEANEPIPDKPRMIPNYEFAAVIHGPYSKQCIFERIVEGCHMTDHVVCGSDYYRCHEIAWHIANLVKPGESQ